jgi:hypothetical protein
MVKIEFFLLLPIENHCGQNVEILKSFLGICNLHYELKYRSLNGYIQFTGQFVVILAQSWKNSAKFAQNTNLWHFKSCLTSAE